LLYSEPDKVSEGYLLKIYVTSINLLEEDIDILLTNIAVNQLIFTNEENEIKSIYGIAGDLAFEINSTVSGNINVTNLANGIYFLVFKYPYQSTYSKVKFCKM